MLCGLLDVETMMRELVQRLLMDGMGEVLGVRARLDLCPMARFI